MGTKSEKKRELVPTKITLATKLHTSAQICAQTISCWTQMLIFGHKKFSPHAVLKLAPNIPHMGASVPMFGDILSIFGHIWAQNDCWGYLGAIGY